MRYAYVNGSDVRMLPMGEAFTLNGMQFPANWLDLATETDRAARSIYPVVFTGTEKDQCYWWNTENPPAFNGTAVVIERAATPMDLATVKARDIAASKTSAGAILKATDWYIVRQAETSTPVPPLVATYRAAVRAAQTDYETAVNAATTLDELALLKPEWPEEPK